ncbi:MAG TPA: OPT/YSL family transporter [Phycisphaerales bacterium]|nr:OPT/YSL family transporter [Phycisphaerales bacterium]
MAIEHLSDEQIRTWTIDQKDRWWLERVWKGDMPQLTIRSAITGFMLGGILSATNLYIGAKTGWTLGVGLTSVILAFAMFRVMSRMGLARDFSLLENNCMQSIATAAGYMTGPLISGLAAYMMVTNAIMPWHQMLLFNVVLSLLGVLVAFPMKRRFINDEQAPFPEGAACGVVLDTLYSSAAAVGLFKARVLLIVGLATAFLRLISAEATQTALQVKLLGMERARWIPEHMLDWVYWGMAKARGVTIDKIEHFRLRGIPIEQMGLAPAMDFAMLGAGGLMGMRSTLNMMAGMVVVWVGLVPWLIQVGDITPARVVDGAAVYTRADILNKWPLWPGVCIVVLASLVAFFAKPQVILSAFKGLFGKRQARSETAEAMSRIELPLWISIVGIPIIGAVGVWMAHEWFGVKWYWGALSIPLIIALSLIAVSSTALTSITPTGALSKITQLTFGVLDRANPATNLMTACMTTEVSSNAANLLMDIKPGYMLGAKPRQQAIGHCIGIFAGALASTPLFYLLFLHSYSPGEDVGEVLTSGEFSFVAAVQWRGISDVITGVTSGQGLSIPWSAQVAMIVGSAVAIVGEIVRIASRNRVPISPVALGLGVVLPPESTVWMFMGSLVFWMASLRYARRKESFGHRFWVDTREPICAGLIAGWSLMGIADILIGIANEKLW